MTHSTSCVPPNNFSLETFHQGALSLTNRLIQTIQEIFQTVVGYLIDLITAIGDFCCCGCLQRRISPISPASTPSPVPSTPSSPSSSPPQSPLLAPPHVTQSAGTMPPPTPITKPSPTSMPPTGRPVLTSLTEIPRAIYESVRINPAKLSEAPTPFDLGILQHIADHVDLPISTRELYPLFDQIFHNMPSHKILVRDDFGANIHKSEARARIEIHYLSYIELYRNSLGNYNQEVAHSMELFLKGIIFELRKESLSLEKKQEAIRRLIRASGHCAPRRHEEVKKIYLTLTSQMETLKEIVLQYLQQAKEDLFLDYYSLSTEPVMTLNWIRTMVGTNLGLDTNPINLHDIHINLHDARSPDNPHVRHQFRDQFLITARKIFTPENYLRVMMYSLNQRIDSDPEFATTVSRFIDDAIRKHVEQGDLTFREQEALPTPYQDDFNEVDSCRLTPEGVRFLLVHFGWLTPNQPNGHLVPVERS